MIIGYKGITIDMKTAKIRYQEWYEQLHGTSDIDREAQVKLLQELEKISKKEEYIHDAFYRDMEFGTGGLRGVMGVGTNRMNIYTVGRASQALADYLNQKYPDIEKAAAIACDSRVNSYLFAAETASVLAANGIKVFLYPEIMPVPCLSYAVRYLKCRAGIMITASHNASKYNGYKVYGDDGCQITNNTADAISENIHKTDIFKDVKRMDYKEAFDDGTITYIPDDVYRSYLECVKHASVYGQRYVTDKSEPIIYSPLNGTGRKPVSDILNQMGYRNIIIVKEQEQPDGTFPTCPYPNPEDGASMTLGIQYAGRYGADIVLATDPDCDRVGLAVKHKDTYKLLNANQTGVLLFDYICAGRISDKSMPVHPVMMKTIVTTDMSERIAEHYNVDVVNVLTGFKYIGEQIGALERKGEINDFIFGFEESYGYLSGTYVRDKDGVNAALLICEMFHYYKSCGISLLDKLEELYKTYGYYCDAQHSCILEGDDGQKKIQTIMQTLRGGIKTLGDKKVIRVMDYLYGIDNLPKSNVIKFVLEDNCSVIIRPSGTEPKLKMYCSVRGKTPEESESLEIRISRDIADNYLCL